MSIVIPKEYWHGTECVKNEIPWQTPESIFYLDKILKPDDVVLEIGSGGSTLFFARRCAKVIALETSAAWHATMSRTIEDLGLTNVALILAPSQSGAEAAIAARAIKDVTVASVDSVHGFDRSAFLETVLKHHKGLRTLVLDNYGEPVLFPRHAHMTLLQAMTLCQGAGWRGEDFNDSHWCGRGTRILTRAEIAHEAIPI